MFRGKLEQNEQNGYAVHSLVGTLLALLEEAAIALRIPFLFESNHVSHSKQLRALTSKRLAVAC
jgi:hypothetical protein